VFIFLKRERRFNLKLEQDRKGKIEIMVEFLAEALEGKSEIDLIESSLDPKISSCCLDLLCQKKLLNNLDLVVYKTTEKGKSFVKDYNRIKELIQS